MGQHSNADVLAAHLAAWLDGFTFERDGLGQDVAMAVIRGSGPRVGGILGRITKRVTPNGQDWPKNSREYAAEKQREYGWSDPNLRTGQMVSEASLAGDIRISPELVELHYGTGEPPSISRSPTGHLSDADESITDREKATYAHASGRGFFGVGHGDHEAVMKVGLAHLNAMVREHNSGIQA